jgi:hypothetical protein
MRVAHSGTVALSDLVILLPEYSWFKVSEARSEAPHRPPKARETSRGSGHGKIDRKISGRLIN